MTWKPVKGITPLTEAEDELARREAYGTCDKGLSTGRGEIFSIHAGGPLRKCSGDQGLYVNQQGKYFQCACCSKCRDKCWSTLMDRLEDLGKTTGISNTTMTDSKYEGLTYGQALEQLRADGRKDK